MYDPYALGLTVGRINGDEAQVLCPFHNDRHFGNASVNLDSGKFYCFSCGSKSGVKQLAKLLGGTVKTSFSSKLARRMEEDWEWMLSSPLATHNKYLLSRSVPKMLIAHLGIRDVKDGVAFILRNEDGHPIGAQVRWSDGRVPRYKLFGKRSAIWPWCNIKEAKRNETIYVVEGVFGVIRGMQAGFKVVAVMGASAISNASIALNGHRTRIMFDDDNAGYVGAAKFMKAKQSEVLIPGVQADEISILEWISIARHGNFTTRIVDLPIVIKH